MKWRWESLIAACLASSAGVLGSITAFREFWALEPLTMRWVASWCSVLLGVGFAAIPFALRAAYLSGSVDNQSADKGGE